MRRYKARALFSAEMSGNFEDKNDDKDYVIPWTKSGDTSKTYAVIAVAKDVVEESLMDIWKLNTSSSAATPQQSKRIYADTKFWEYKIVILNMRIKKFGCGSLPDILRDF